MSPGRRCQPKWERESKMDISLERDEQHEHFMEIALREARGAAASGEVPVGAVLVLDDRILACGHNRSIRSMDPTAHAEMEALRQGAQVLGNYRMEGCRLYVTKEPCLMCCGAMIHARIRELIVGARDEKSGAVWSRAQLLDLPWLNHRIISRFGILEESCRSVLQDFFQQRRETRKKEKSSADPLPSLENEPQVW